MTAQMNPVKMTVDVLIILITFVVIALLLATVEKDVKWVRCMPFLTESCEIKLHTYCHNIVCAL